MFSYEHLSAFCATAETGSYSQAARLLGKDRTTVREQIKILEESYAIVLFEIEGKKAKLTPLAEQFYQQAKILLKHSEKLHHSLNTCYLTPPVEVEIFHDVAVPQQLIRYTSQAMRQSYPQLRLHWLQRNRQEALTAVASGHYQVAIMQSQQRNQHQLPLDFMSLGQAPLAVYCGAHHPLTQSDRVTMAQLQLETQLISENHMKNQPDLFAVSPNLNLVSNHDHLLALVQDDGWAILSCSHAQPYVDHGKLVQLQIKELANRLYIDLTFYYTANLEHTPELKVLRKVLRQYAQVYMK
ncbi:hypothetical protein VST7929_01125 [Vibrio stylophorae]|uniref:HTH lysR-type domain-containing protein n=1 Tax=Vibrio stylophorae TaxID=659351 RepID=A0ABN8DTF0_9VIBR|nr:LysR family transcriptional regulator [Vibrio stylophorae]CAH0533261.1 hypothetical protein VST7929_01125 [Vibrio stylophorae]